MNQTQSGNSGRVQITNNEPNSTLYILSKNPGNSNNSTVINHNQMRSREENARLYVPAPKPKSPVTRNISSVNNNIPNRNQNQNQQIQKNQKTTAVTVAKPAPKPQVHKSVQNNINNNIKNNTVQNIEKKQSPVKRLAGKFKKSGLGLIDSYFNAYYFYYDWKSERTGRKTKDYLDTIAKHPKGWGKNKSESDIYEKNDYDKYIAFLSFIASLWGFICILLKPVRNFFKSIGDFFVTFANASKASKNIGYIAQKAFAFLLPVVSIIFTVAIISDIYSFKPDLELSYNGQNIGFVDSKETVGKVVSLLENNISSVLNESYEFNGDLSYKIVLTKNKSYVSEGDLYNLMYNSPQIQNAITSAYLLYIDGELIGAVENKSEINQVLSEILEENAGDIGDDGTIGFANEINIIENKYAKRDVVTQDELKDILTYTPDNANTAVAGAMFSSENGGGVYSDNKSAENLNGDYVNIPDDSEIPLANLDALSLDYADYLEETAAESEDIAAIAAASSIDLTPEAINTIPRGFLSSNENNQQDNILSRLSRTSGSTAAGAIQFKKIKTETYTVEVPFEVKYVDSALYYTGTQTVQTYGVNGENMITADVTYIDEDEISREIKAVETIKAPVTKIVLVGTKIKPLTVPTGGFIRPVNGGYISTYYSKSHRAIDIPMPYGSPVKAADGGTVIYAGSHSSYGNYVKIRHNDGFVTLYAHLSSISVDYGEKVFQGQEIGKIGSTGNSTGNHLHFEIIKNGIQMDPLSYIK